MGIRFACPNGHKLNVKDHLAGKRGICPSCGAKFVIPSEAADSSAARQPVTDSPSVILAPETTQSPGAPVIVAPQPASSAAPQTVVVTPPTAIAPQPAIPSAAPPPEVIIREAPPDVAEIPNEAAPVAQYVAHRRRSRKLQKAVAIALFAMVIVLAIVLIWVLSSDPQGVETSSGVTRQAPRLATIDKCVWISIAIGDSIQ